MRTIGQVHLQRWAGLALAAAVLTSCATSDYERARGMSPTGTPFTQALYEAYLEESAVAFEETNEALSDAFAARAMAAAGGTVVAPALPEAGALVAGAAPVSDFEVARVRLMAALAQGRSEAPALAAQAQAAFDCWYLRSIDPESRSGQAERCRVQLDLAQVALEEALAPPLPDPAQFTAYFGFDEWLLTAEALNVIGDAMEVARLGGHQQIVLGGHTDTSGPADYNDRLSLLRAESVKATMVELGAVPEAIRVIAFGETNLAVPTPDGVREPRNRRVVIDLVP